MIKTTVAGSLPKPSWLAQPEMIWAPWHLKDEALLEGQRDAALAWIKIQEDADIDIVSDGEQFRKHFVHGFLESIDGIDWQKITTMGIRNDRYDAQVPTVTSKLSRGGSVHGAATEFCRAHTARELKVTLPGPMTICDTIADEHYGSRYDMAMAFAELLNDEARELNALGVDVIQFDEPAFNAFMAEAREWGVDALNRSIEGLDCRTAVHICYGYGIQQNIDWKQTLGDGGGGGGGGGGYEEFFPALNKCNINQVSLECAGSKVPFEVIALLKDKEILVGTIDVATNAVETPEMVADTLRRAAEFVELDRIVACTNCGMAPLPRDVAEGKLKALGAGAALLRKELG